MKKLIIKPIISWLLGLYSYERSKKAGRYLDVLYTHWLKKSFQYIGNNSIIERRTKIYNAERMKIGENVYIRKYSNLSAWTEYSGQQFNPVISIGNNCSIGTFANISAVNRIVLKENVLIGKWVTIIDHAHGEFNKEEANTVPAYRNLFSKGEIVIEANVWIADKVTICSNVRIGQGAIIGANSVVTKDVQPYTMVGGSPARTIKKLDL